MTKQELIKGLKYLGTAYNKEFDEVQASIWYEHLLNVEYQDFVVAIKTIVKTSKYIPSIAEVLEMCEKTQKQNTISIFEKMRQDGYFKSELELTKAIMWFEEGIIPKWLKEDMKKYQSKEILKGSKTKMIGRE